MKYTVRDIATIIEEFAPLRLQEDYDNCGLNVGNYDTVVSSALMCVDVTEAIIDEAIEKGVNLVVSHHPLAFHPFVVLTDSDTTQRAVRKAVVAGISLYAAHTNLDCAAGGMSFRLAEKLGLTNLATLVPNEGDPTTGFGVIGELPQQWEVKKYLEKIKEITDCKSIRHSELCISRVGRVAVSTGSGGSFIRAAIAAGADLFVTADLRYNDFFTADGRIVVADVGHFESEYCAIELLFDIIRKKIPTFVLHKGDNSVNPVNYFI